MKTKKITFILFEKRRWCVLDSNPGRQDGRRADESTEHPQEITFITE